jgi:hypothetical protein
MASPTGENSNRKGSNRQLGSLDDETLDRLFETFQEWNFEFNRIAGAAKVEGGNAIKGKPPLL